MKWTRQSYPWKRRFALLPVTLGDGPTHTTIWLEWYWARFCGDCYEVSFTDPAMNEKGLSIHHSSAAAPVVADGWVIAGRRLSEAERGINEFRNGGYVWVAHVPYGTDLYMAAPSPGES